MGISWACRDVVASRVGWGLSVLEVVGCRLMVRCWILDPPLSGNVEKGKKGKDARRVFTRTALFDDAS